MNKKNFMNDKHPITPPDDLVDQWYETADNVSEDVIIGVSNRAAQWGADQELDACEEWVEANFGQLPAHNLHQFRRPKPPSLKEQALAELEKVDMLWDTSEFGADTLSALDTIRRALETLPND